MCAFIFFIFQILDFIFVRWFRLLIFDCMTVSTKLNGNQESVILFDFTKSETRSSTEPRSPHSPVNEWLHRLSMQYVLTYLNFQPFLQGYDDYSPSKNKDMLELKIRKKYFTVVRQFTYRQVLSDHASQFCSQFLNAACFPLKRISKPFKRFPQSVKRMSKPFKRFHECMKRMQFFLNG